MDVPVPTVLLFDIDGTLLLTGGAGRRAFERAFAELTGRADAVQGFSFAGMTDRAIARAGLEALGRPPDATLMEALIVRYLIGLDDELARSHAYTVMPGVERVLPALVGRKGVALGLGTGNVRRGAEAKLRRAALWEHFGFGGFGCDAERRDELLRVGAARGAAELGLPVSACRVVVIGDTTRDVAAALAIGAECVGVETGGVAAAELREAGAAAVYRDLAAADVIHRLLIGTGAG
jgi:phosphoglycolate phosphatase